MTKNDELLYLHTPNKGEQELRCLVSDKYLPISAVEELKSQFIGVYASVDELMDDYPEYLL
jgi:hypothetical protein